MHAKTCRSCLILPSRCARTGQRKMYLPEGLCTNVKLDIIPQSCIILPSRSARIGQRKVYLPEGLCTDVKFEILPQKLYVSSLYHVANISCTSDIPNHAHTGYVGCRHAFASIESNTSSKCMLRFLRLITDTALCTSSAKCTRQL